MATDFGSGGWGEALGAFAGSTSGIGGCGGANCANAFGPVPVVPMIGGFIVMPNARRAFLGVGLVAYVIVGGDLN